MGLYEFVCLLNLFLKNFVSISLHKRKWIQWIGMSEWWMNNNQFLNEKDTLKLSSFSTKKLEIKLKYHQRMNQPNQWKLIFTFLWEFSFFYKEQELWKKNNWNWFALQKRRFNWNYLKLLQNESNKKNLFFFFGKKILLTSTQY
jgi:hypothetical protein